MEKSCYYPFLKRPLNITISTDTFTTKCDFIVLSQVNEISLTVK